jgi:hypothetical protein
MENTNLPTRQILTADELIFILQGSEEAQKKYPMYYKNLSNFNLIEVSNINVSGKVTMTNEQYSINSHIHIRNGTFLNSVNLQNCNFERSLSIDKVCFEASLDFNNNNIKGDFQFIANTIKETFSITISHIMGKTLILENKCIGVYSIITSSFDEDTTIDGVFKDNVLIHSDVIFCRMLKINGNFGKNILMNGDFFNDVEISGNIKNALHIKESTFYQKLNLERTIKCPTVEILNKAFIEHLYIKSSNIKSINIFAATISIITFSNAIYNKDTMIQLVDIQPKELRFENVQNISGNIVLSGINANNEEGLLHISNSDLGRVNLIDCNFEPYKLAFHSSKIIDVFVAGTNMPKPENINKVPLDDDGLPTLNNVDYVRSLDQKRLALIQIKKIYESRGDYVKAGKYHAEEMETYLRILCKEQRRDKIGEILLLLLNRVSNYHGQEWLRALIMALLVGAGLFYYYLSSFPPTLEIPDAWYSFLSFLTPIHKNDFLVNADCLTTKAKNIDDISRIIITYFEYQLVQAFRKHGKQ